jgi:hypothetical protein
MFDLNENPNFTKQEILSKIRILKFNHKNINYLESKNGANNPKISHLM